MLVFDGLCTLSLASCFLKSVLSTGNTLELKLMVCKDLWESQGWFDSSLRFRLPKLLGSWLREQRWGSGRGAASFTLQLCDSGGNIEPRCI